VTRRTKIAWKAKLTRLLHSYLLVGIVLTSVFFVALDWAANRVIVPSDTLKISQVAPRVGADDPAWSYFHPVWTKDPQWSLFSIDNTNFDPFFASATEARLYVADPDNRIESDFKVPETLRRRVMFWMEIYSHYSSRTRVVHDRNDPGKVYGFIDFRPVYRAMGASPATETKVANLENKIMKLLKEKLREAAGLTKTNLLSPEEKGQLQSLLSTMGASTPAAATLAITNVRTQTGQSDMFLQALYRARNLLPHIESVFRKYDLPVGLARIPFVESSFNANAKSSEGAMGIWQFMPETAQEWINDESMWSDPLKQTKSAAKMLKLQRGVLPDWSTTITAYNSGVGRVRRIVGKHRLKNAYTFCDLPSSEGIGFAGENFYSEFLAANLVEAYKEQLFSRWLGQQEFQAIFKGNIPLPKDICSAM
jgi:membrane-bound lytic murein transglycosylase D